MFYIAAKIIDLSVQRGVVACTGIAFQWLGLAAVEFYKQYSYGHVSCYDTYIKEPHSVASSHFFLTLHPCR
jgi:hypothetical protein